LSLIKDDCDFLLAIRRFEVKKFKNYHLVSDVKQIKKRSKRYKDFSPNGTDLKGGWQSLIEKVNQEVVNRIGCLLHSET
jgi:hypothetical protein